MSPIDNHEGPAPDEHRPAGILLFWGECSFFSRDEQRLVPPRSRPDTFRSRFKVETGLMPLVPWSRLPVGQVNWR
jgi:hypothetical protein